MHLRCTLHKTFRQISCMGFTFFITHFFPIWDYFIVNVCTFVYFHKYRFKAIKMKSIKCTTKLLDRILIGARIREIQAKEVR